MFGYYIVQIGGPTSNNEILASSTIHNHIVVNPAISLNQNVLAIQCKLEELPFLPKSIDVMVLIHILEFVSNPTIIIKEIYDALIKGGYLIIFGFNPYSLWGITKLIKNSKESIWQGKWITPSKLQHLLSTTNFNVGDYQTFYFRSPTCQTKKLSFAETLGKLFCPYFGASYMMVAQKASRLITPITNLKQLVKHQKTVIVKGLPKPTSRVATCNRK